MLRILRECAGGSGASLQNPATRRCRTVPRNASEHEAAAPAWGHRGCRPSGRIRRRGTTRGRSGCSARVGRRRDRVGAARGRLAGIALRGFPRARYAAAACGAVAQASRRALVNRLTANAISPTTVIVAPTFTAAFAAGLPANITASAW